MQHGRKICTGCQVALKGPHVGRFRSARDGPAQINLIAQIMQAEQVRNRTRANAHQCHAHGFHLSAFLSMAKDCARKDNSQTANTWSWVMQVWLRSQMSLTRRRKKSSGAWLQSM